jgi:hypothetical protein
MVEANNVAAIHQRKAGIGEGEGPWPEGKLMMGVGSLDIGPLGTHIQLIILSLWLAISDLKECSIEVV